MKLKLEIEVDYDAETMHGNEPESIEWFRDSVLLNPAEDEPLILYSNCIGDEIGVVRVTRIISGLSNAKLSGPWCVEFQGFLQGTILREFETEERARQWTAQCGKTREAKIFKKPNAELSGGEAVRSDDLLARSRDYSIALQRAIEYHCRGVDVPPAIAAHCPYHAKMLNEHLANKETTK